MDGAGPSTDVGDPATGDVLVSWPDASLDQADKAVTAARAAFGAWRDPRVCAANGTATHLELGGCTTTERGYVHRRHPLPGWGRRSRHRLRDWSREPAGSSRWETSGSTTRSSTTWPPPFGGMRASGTVRELGPEALDSFTRPRHVHWNLDLVRKNWWFREE